MIYSKFPPFDLYLNTLLFCPSYTLYKDISIQGTSKNSIFSANTLAVANASAHFMGGVLLCRIG